MDLVWQYRCYIALTLLMNVGLALLVTLVPYVGLALIVLPKGRDFVFTLYRLLCVPRVHIDTSGGVQQENLRSIVCIITAYKESSADVISTVRSLIGQRETTMLHPGVVVISDGVKQYVDILEQSRTIGNISYTTYGGVPSTCTILTGLIDSVSVVVLQKLKNAGKKDSLLLCDALFIGSLLQSHGKMVLEELGTPGACFMFHTDADTTVKKGSLMRMSNVLLSNSYVAAVSGFVSIDISYNPLVMSQAFQYHYGQVVRKSAESMWGKIMCLPGCISMVNMGHPAVRRANILYASMPVNEWFLEQNLFLQGTDRLYTNCVSQNSMHTYIVMDRGSVAYTKPPTTFKHYLQQRKRWGSNAITNNVVSLMGRNYWIRTRINSVVELIKSHTVIARASSTIYFIVKLHDVDPTALIAAGVAFTIPFCAFLLDLLTETGDIRLSLWLLLCVIPGKIMATFLSVSTFLYTLIHFGDTQWGATHDDSYPTSDPRHGHEYNTP